MPLVCWSLRKRALGNVADFFPVDSIGTGRGVFRGGKRFLPFSQLGLRPLGGLLHRLVFPRAELRERGPGLDRPLLADLRREEMDAKPALLRKLLPEIMKERRRLLDLPAVDARSGEVVLQLAGRLGDRLGRILARLVDVAEIDQLPDRFLGVDRVDLRVGGWRPSSPSTASQESKYSVAGAAS